MYRSRLAVPLILLTAAAAAHAQTYTETFADADLRGPRLFGSAAVDAGSLRLTPFETGRSGAVVIGGGLVSSFTASFDYFYNTPGFFPTADGVSFNLGRVPDAALPGAAENGPGNGLTVSIDIFDFFSNGITLDDGGVRVFVNGVQIASGGAFQTGTNENAFRLVTIRLDPDGTLDVSYNGVAVFTNLATGYTPDPAHRFSIAARTGGERSEQRVDNVSIDATSPSADACASAREVHGDGVFWFDTTAATTDGVQQIPGCNPGPTRPFGRDVWFAWTPAASGRALITTDGLAAFNTMLAAYHDLAPCPSALGQLACHNDLGNLQSAIVFPVVQGQRYLVRVGGVDGSPTPAGRGAITIATAPYCPGDFDRSGGAPEVSDIFAFLSVWFAGCP